MIYKRYALFCFLLLAGTILPIVNEKGFSLMPSVMAQSGDIETLMQQAFQYTQTGKPQQAIEFFQQALKLNQQKEDKEIEAFAHLGLGLNYDNIGQPQPALVQYNQALLIFRELKVRSGEATTLSNIGAVYGKIGKPEEALKYFNQALPIRREVGDRRVEATTLNNIGLVYDSIGKPEEALKYYNQALPISREVGDRRGEATTLNNIGGVYEGIGKPEEALKFFNQALPIRHEVGDLGGEATTLNNIGGVYQGIGKPEKALKYFNQALPMLREVGDRRLEATTLNNIGLVYGRIGKPEKALKFFNQALPMLREVGDRKMESTTLSNIGEVYRGIGKPEEALKYFNQALPMLREVGDRRVEATTLNNIGAVYGGIGKPEEALKYYNQALPILRAVGDRAREGVILNNIGLVYDSIGKPEEALKYYNQALPILRAVGDRSGEATTLNNIGLVYDSIGKPEEALKYYNQALPILLAVGDRRVEATTLNNIGAVYQGIGKPEEVLKYYNQALPILLAVGDRRVEATTLNNIGFVYSDISKPEEALKFYNQALLISREVGDRPVEATTLNNIGFVYRDTNQPANAITNLEASAEIKLNLRGRLTRENRADFIKANRGTAIGLIDLLIRQNQPEKAYQWANRFTTFDLANYSLLINAKVANPEAQKALDNWNTQNLQLANLYQDLQKNFSEPKSKQYRELEQKINQQREPLINQYPELADLLETKPTDIAQLQKSIPSNTILLHPILLTGIKNVPNTVALFRLTRDSLTVTQIPLPKDFNQLVNQYRNQLADHLNSDYLVTSSQLYDILIRPIEQQIKSNSPKNLAIIATDQLRYIPFESLYDSKNEQYLLQKYPISYLTRISTANIPNSPSKTPKNLQALALANPKPTNQELKGTEKEAENLLKIFPQSETYLGEKATLDTFKTQASRFSILHLGTHGCFELAGCPNLKMQANTILFANNQQYNIADAALLGLKNTELITLSACQTAKEANANGQEISGLAYVLERAGAKSVIASLWNAEDNTSAEIMTQFYQNLQKGMTKSEAMQKAKLSQIEENPKPYFWSPFILIGDAQ